MDIIISEYTYIYQHFIHFYERIEKKSFLYSHLDTRFITIRNIQKCIAIRKIRLAKQKVFKNRVAKETTYNTDYFFTALSQAISLNSIIFYHHIRYPTISLCFIHQVLYGKSRSRSIVT